MVEASQYIDKLENRPHVAEVVSRPQYINTDKDAILGRLLGDYDYGDGRTEDDPKYMTFFDRDTGFPWKSHGLWWLSQFRRWGRRPVGGPRAAQLGRDRRERQRCTRGAEYEFRHHRADRLLAAGHCA